MPLVIGINEIPSPRERLKGYWTGNPRRVVFWVATVWLVLELAAGGIEDLMRGPAAIFGGEHVDVAVSLLGYPVYVLLFLGVLKILGAGVIIAPGFLRLKEWAYAGSFFQIALAAGSIALVGLGLENLIYPMMVMLITLVSWALRPPSRVLA